MIEVKNLTFGYGEKYIFEDYNNQFSSGIHLIKGFSSCGKTTLLKLIAGLLSFKQGSITYKGKAVGGKAYLRDQLGYVFQDLNLLPDASIERNMLIRASLNSNDMKLITQRIQEFSAMLGLTDLMQSSPEQLSLGQQQRAAVMRAIIHMPHILIMDEPTSSLDDLNTEVIKRVIEQFVHLNKDRVVLVATHDERLNSIADEIYDFNKFLPIDRHLETMVRSTR